MRWTGQPVHLFGDQRPAHGGIRHVQASDLAELWDAIARVRLGQGDYRGTRRAQAAASYFRGRR